MPLQRTQIPVKFTGGTDTKTAEQLVVPGSFLRLDNCVRRKTGRIEKRNGFEYLSRAVVSSDSTITSGKKIDTFGSDVLLLDTNRLYSYISSTDQWADRGEIASVLVDSDPLVRNSFKQALPDIATLNGLTATVYEDSRSSNTIRYTIVNDATGAAIVYDAIVASNAERPRIAAINNNTFLIGWRDTSTSAMGLATIAIDDPATLTARTAVVSGSFVDGPWDLTAFGPFALAVFNTTGNEVEYAPINHLGEIGTGLNGMPLPTTVAYEGTNGIAVVADSTNGLFFSALASSTGVRAVVLPYTLLASMESSEVTAADIRNVAIGTKDDNTALIYVEIGDPADVADRKNQLISSIAVTYDPGTTTTTAGALTEFKRSVGLASKIWLFDGHYYVTSVFDSALQSTYFVIKDNGYIVSKALPGLSGGLSQDSSDALKTGISSVIVDSQGRYGTAGRVKNRLQADNDGEILATSVGIERLSFTFGGENFDADTIGSNYLIAGGIMLAYDGVSATELNFHVYPEDIGLATNGSGSLPAGTYYYSVIYEWQDAKGQIHRSAPSVETSIAVSGSQGVDLTIPTLRLTAKTDNRADAKIVVYSGVAGDDTVMYRIAETTNDPSVDTVQISDNSRASNYTQGEVLYTTGGVVESTAPSASKVVTTHKNRLWIGGLEDGYTLWYSREQVYGEGICFSEFFSLRVDPRGGPITALGSIDESLIIFKKDAIFVLRGDGPLDTGAQNDYGQAALISGEIGCDNPKSVVLTINGLMFKSDKGIYQLDRSLGLRYVGDRVENYNSEEVTSAVVMEDVNEVRFTTKAGRALIYNYYFDQWSTFTNYQSESAVKGLNSYLHLKADGRVGMENAGFNDAGARYSMAIETSWFSFTDVQGYQRIYYIMGLGDYISNHHTRIKMAYDFEDAYAETVYFNVDTALNLSYYGDDALYGDSKVYGGTGSSVYQWYLRPRRQKCQSIKLLIEDVDTISTNGGGSFNFVDLTFMVGAKMGGPRVRGGKEV